MKTKILIIVIILLTLLTGGYFMRTFLIDLFSRRGSKQDLIGQQRDNMDKYNYSNEYPPKSWLIRKVTKEEVIKELDLNNSESSFLKEGKEFLEKSKIEDEILFYRSPDETWKNEMGKAGYVIMRNGKPIDSILYFEN